MGRLTRYSLYLIVLGLLGFAGWAMFAQLTPPTRDIVIDAPAPGAAAPSGAGDG